MKLRYHAVDALVYVTENGYTRVVATCRTGHEAQTLAAKLNGVFVP